MAFHLTSSNYTLANSHLTALCSPSTTPSTIDLDECLGNKDGVLEWGGKKLSKSSRNLTLDGTVLRGEVRKCDGTWTEARVDLAEGIANLHGRLVFI
ncbi:Cyanovirin-N, partial [Ascobolus immersus RN42]